MEANSIVIDLALYAVFWEFYSLSVNKSIKNRFNLESTCSFDLGFVETDYMDVL